MDRMNRVSGTNDAGLRIRKVSRNGSSSSFEPLSPLHEEEEMSGISGTRHQHQQQQHRNKKSKDGLMDQLKDAPNVVRRYVSALRPWSFPASVTPVLLGAVLAYKSSLNSSPTGSGLFDPFILLLTLFTVVAVHAAGNVANTYYDYVKHVDRGKQSLDRTLLDHQLTVDELTAVGVFAYSAGCFGMVCLCFLSPASIEHLALVFFSGLSASFAYTGGIGFKYIGLGDLVILIIFGPTSLLFSYMAQTGSLDVRAALYAIPLALNTEAIFHANNTRNLESDRNSGAVNLAILIGPQLSHVMYALLLFVPYIVFIFVGLHHSVFFFIPLVTFPQAIRLEKEFRSKNLNKLSRKTAQLNLYFGIFYLLACCLTEAPKLPFLFARTGTFVSD